MIIKVDVEGEGIEFDLRTPWAAVSCAKGCGPMAYVETCDGNVIGNAHGLAHGISVEQIEAVSHIMAAGPEMLAALEMVEIRIANGSQLWNTEVQMIRQAIAKARGR